MPDYHDSPAFAHTDCRQLLATGGPFAESLPGFESRPGQLQMTGLIQRAMASQQACVVEAGSGCGKTLAYLLPALQCPGRVIISTASHYLQQQLLHRDIPLVLKVLGQRRSLALLKGRSNYLCPRQMKLQLAAEAGLPRELLAPLRAVQQRFRRRRGGDDHAGDLSLMALPAVLKARLSCSAEECLGKLCPDYRDCPLVVARQRAEQAEILVLNHSLLMGQQAAEQAVRLEPLASQSLLRADRVVVDEAHRLLDFADSAAGLQLGSGQLRRFYRDCLRAVASCCPEDRQASKLLQRGRQWLVDCVQQIPDLQAYSELAHRQLLRQCIALLESLTSWFALNRERAFPLQGLARRHSQLLILLVQIYRQPGLCWWQRRGRGFVIQHCSPEPDAALRQLFSRIDKSRWLFTSATLSVAGSPDQFLSRLGLATDVFHRIDSDFDFQQRVRLYLPATAATPGSDEYPCAFIEQLKPFLAACAGRVLVLFSSHRALQQAAQALRPLLVASNRALWVQGEVDNYRLIEHFRANDGGVLLGTGSFWEGLDLSGVPLSGLVIEKLPFASPLDPLVSLRSDYLRRRGVDSFQQYLLPDAVIRFRQGCGRLMRRRDDRGVIMLADPRLRHKAYGQQFLQSLPAIPVVKNTEQLRNFFEQTGTDAD